MSISQRFKTLLFNLDLNARELANELSVAQSTVSKSISGDTLPSSKMLIPLGEKLNVNVNWLLFGNGEMFLSGQISTNHKIINGDNNHTQVGNNSKNTINSNNNLINSNNSNNTEVESLKKDNKSLNKEIKSLNRVIESQEKLISVLEKNQK